MVEAGMDAEMPQDAEKRRDEEKWGAEPYGAYRGYYTTYELGQYGSLGSGLLGGWSGADYGGFFDAPAPAQGEAESERKRLIGGGVTRREWSTPAAARGAVRRPGRRWPSPAIPPSTPPARWG